VNSLNLLKSWVRLLRLPFYSVALLPLWAGILIGVKEGYSISFNIIILGSIGVIFIITATHLLGEYFDLEADRLNKDFNIFSGGSRVLINDNVIKPELVFYAGMTSALFAIITGFALYVIFRFSTAILILGGIGLLSGVFYSSRPIQFSYKGWGEILIGFCYGWLTLNTGFYLVTKHFSPVVTIYSLPIVFSIIAVIVINEFPDYESDFKGGKKNLVVKLGKEKMSIVYLALLWASVMSVFIFLSHFKKYIIIIELMITGLTVVNSLLISKHRSKKHLQVLCGTTLLINLLYNLILILNFL